MAWTAVGTFTLGTAATQAVTNTTAGDVRVVWTGSSSATPVVSGGGVTTWNQTVVYTGTNTAADLLIAWGIITSTGSQTLSMTHTPFETSSQEFAPPGATPTLDVSGHLSGSTTGAAVAGVSLTGTAGDLWCGYNVNVNSCGAGNTTGVTYKTTSTSNQLGWDLNSPSGAFAPTWGPTGAWDTLALMLISVTSVVTFVPKPLIVPQARNRVASF